MRLGVLLDSEDDAEVTGFAIDHRKVAPGTVFGAFKGSRFNGEDFIARAISDGAVAVVTAPDVSAPGATLVASENPRRRFAQLAARFFAPFPAVAVAVTGTNGKTSTVELTRQLWRLAGLSAASIGTLGITTNDEQASTGLTTPDVATFLANMAGLKREGVDHVAFEASSHGLDQYRVEGVTLQAAAFTNLTRDHLDYHMTMEAYEAAKLRLFAEMLPAAGKAVIWADDPASARFAGAARTRGIEVLTVGEHGETLRLLGRSIGQLGQRLTIEANGETHNVMLPLIGAYQVSNALVAAGLVIACCGDVKATLANLARVQGVRGRLERAVITRAGTPVYVDYAHTPDGLEAALAALRPHASGKLFLVFGAGGDRDVGKRAEMGAIAARHADVAIITDDNPRGEDPIVIRAAIQSTAPAARDIGDRRTAIAAAIAEAGKDDIVLIAGKGHETGQIVGDRVLPFDDVIVARECAV